MNSLHIVSYNLNGIRSAMQKGWLDWLAHTRPDILGVQEIKAQADQIDTVALAQLGYHCHWLSAQKPGYSGVGLLSRTSPDAVLTGCDHPEFDAEGRVIRADFGPLTVVNAYFPSGTTGDTRQAVKYRFLDHFQVWLHELRQHRPHLIVMGDFNIAHTEQDIHNPRANQNTSGFLPEERAWMSQWLGSGMIDTFRALHPDVQKYSWWSFRANARANNKGWRIDYIACTELLRPRLLAADLLNDAVHSDHCPCSLHLRWP